MELGAGRETQESSIDLSVGIVFNRKRGDKVKEEDILATIHASNEGKGNRAVEKLLKEIVISNAYEELPLIYGIVK